MNFHKPKRVKRLLGTRNNLERVIVKLTNKMQYENCNFYYYGLLNYFKIIQLLRISGHPLIKNFII